MLEAVTMDFLLDPNIAYLTLAGGLIFAVLAILNPGTGLLELLALFALLAAGWAVYNLPVNAWALLVILVGVGFFIAAVRRARLNILLLPSILALIIGSAFLFRSDIWWQPAVNPVLAATVSILSGGFFWLVARKVLEISQTVPIHSLDNLMGKSGEARSDIHMEGSAQIDGELWSVRSEKPIPTGARIQVVGREGLLLLVKNMDEDQPMM